MSQRSLVEINHDIAEFDNPNWTRQFAMYISSGSPKDLPPGVTYFYRRHHSDDCPMGEPPHGWQNIAPYKEPAFTTKRQRLSLAAKLRQAADAMEGIWKGHVDD